MPIRSSPRIYKILLMILPVGVVVGTIIFMFMYFYLEREDEKNHAVIVSHGLRVSDLEDMVDKFTSRIGEREIETEAGRAGLREGRVDDRRAPRASECRLPGTQVRGGGSSRASVEKFIGGNSWRRKAARGYLCRCLLRRRWRGCGREYRIHYDDAGIIHGS